MNIATGAMSTLLPKLAELVVGEYKLQKGVRGEIRQLEEELRSMTAALHKVAEVPPDQLDEQVKIWASDARELSYDIEDHVDSFILRPKENQHTESFSLKGLICKAADLCKKAKTNHKIHSVVKDIMDQVKKVAERRDRYQIDSIAARPATVVVDPRLEGMYRKASELVGIGRPKNELAKRLLEQDCSSPSRQQSNIVSIVGFGGLGKTTLANSLLQDLKSKFDCHVFVSVSLNPDIMVIFKNILLQLNDKKCVHRDEPWEMKQLIDRIIELLKDKRCLCVIDDLWKESSWDTIKLAFQDGHPGSKMIITTRNKSVAEHVGGGVYELKPLSADDSRELLTKRIFDTNDECPPSLREVTGKILKKCGGVPLAIITTASLLASTPRCLEEWERVNNSVGSGLVGDSLDVDKMMKILSLSYNDLPFHLKTCLLSLSKYPEDYVIRKDVLVWSWIEEGFIKQEEETQRRSAGKSLQEIAESYFNDLINRSLIQPVEDPDRPRDENDGQVHRCQVHDMVLELINQLSAEVGFVTVLSEDGHQASTLTSAMQKRRIRRLSLHNNNNCIKSYAASPKASRQQLSKVRSLDIFGKVTSIPPLSSLRVLRVLQVDNCSGLNRNHLQDLGKLHHLRFLRLYGLEFDELPESIGDLESLETLDIRQPAYRDIGTTDEDLVHLILPVSFAKLRKLVRLLGSSFYLPNGVTLENMTSLRELRGIHVCNLDDLTEICKLGELKVLELHIPDHRFIPPSRANEWIVKCLQSFPTLQVFMVWVSTWHYDTPVDLMTHLPSSLQTFYIGAFFKAFPKWNKSQLSYLTVLHLDLRKVCVLSEHLEQLAELPSLRFLGIFSPLAPHGQENLSSASGFPCLTHLDLFSSIFFLQFRQGTMPKLQKLRLHFDPILTNHRNNIFQWGLTNLPSLRHVVIRKEARDPYNPNNRSYDLDSEGVMDDIRKAVSNHPNHPSFNLA